MSSETKPSAGSRMVNPVQIPPGEWQIINLSRPPIITPTLRQCLCMAQNFPDAEDRRRVSMALSVQHETAAKLAELRHEIWTMLIKLFRMPASR
jgi:hypothetical protein